MRYMSWLDFIHAWRWIIGLSDDAAAILIKDFIVTFDATSIVAQKLNLYLYVEDSCSTDTSKAKSIIMKLATIII